MTTSSQSGTVPPRPSPAWSSRWRALVAWQPRAATLTRYFVFVNVLYLLWLAALKLTPSESANVMHWWHASPLWQALAGGLSETSVVTIGMLTEALAGACLLAFGLGLGGRRSLLAGALLACLVYGFNLVYLFTNPVWVAEMGGFPFLGSGQGVIKYLPMLATGVYLLAQALPAERALARLARLLAWIGVLLVMGWIGSMKFFLFEAHGIEPLLRPHWVFSWMYRYTSVQGVSNVIGLIELGCAALLLLALRWRGLAPFALAGIGLTVACTTSFLFTLPGWQAASGFPLLNGAGVFLLKDQLLLAASALLLRRRGD
jgi:uncharacterized membrane protein YkgB